MLSLITAVLFALLLLVSNVFGSHLPSYQSRQHRNVHHRRAVRRVIRDCSGDDAVPMPSLSMSMREPYSSSGAPRSTPSPSPSSTASPYLNSGTLPKNALFTNNDGDSSAEDPTIGNATTTTTDTDGSLLVALSDTINAIAETIEYANIMATNETDADTSFNSADVWLASEYDTSLDGPEPVMRVRGLSSRRGRRATCTHGDWRCTDMDLERCIWGSWTLIRACSGSNIVCSDAPATTGCVWTWSVQPQAPSQSSTAIATTAAATVTIATTGSSRPQTASMPLVTTIATSLPVNAGPTVTEPTLITTSAAATTSGVSDQNGEDDEDCEEWEDESSSSIATTTTVPLGAGYFANATLTSSHRHLESSAAHATASASYNASSVQIGTNSTSAFPSDVQVTASASGAFLSNITNPSKTLSIIDASTISLSTVSRTASATAGVVTGSPDGIASYSAPHYVVYSDMWLNQMPSVDDLAEFNRFILAFWMSDVGPVDNAQMWMWMSADDRQTVLDEYHAAGIALMVSAFGSTDSPTTNGKDPIATAQGLAAFVIAYGFDGVDIDYEDMGAMNSNVAEAWLVSFQRELRILLPSPYLISHAPVAPWFTSAAVYKTGAYVSVHQNVGDTIDFYNVQFYNQGDGVYEDCNSLIQQSGGYWPGTSVYEINSYAGVPLNKIVIGKPLDPAKASNGYMQPALLHQCVYEAREKGWNGGIMFWEWTSAAPGIMATARG